MTGRIRLAAREKKRLRMVTRNGAWLSAVGFSSFLPRSVPGPLPLHCPTIDSRFVGYCARNEGLSSQGSPLLCGVVIPRKNKVPLWA